MEDDVLVLSLFQFSNKFSLRGGYDIFRLVGSSNTSDQIGLVSVGVNGLNWFSVSVLRQDSASVRFVVDRDHRIFYRS